MRQIIQATFQGLTKNPKFTPEFLNLLFLVTLFQVTVFAHYYQNSFRNNFRRETYEVQDQALQMGHAQEVVVKGSHPFSYVYLKTSENEMQTTLQKINGNPDPFFTTSVKNSDYFKEHEDINSQDLISKFYPLFLRTKVSFLAQNKFETPTQDPGPFNFAPFSASTSEAQKDQVEQSLETFLEEQEIKGLISMPSTRHAEIEFKDNSSKKVFGEISTSKNESIINLPSLDVSEDASGKKPKPEFKAFHHYKIDSKSRLLNFWMQLVAPHSHVLQAEIPYREALIKTLLSRTYQFSVTEANWLKDPEDDDVTILEKRKLRHDFADDYIDNIDWEETKYGKLYLTPCKNVHFINEKAYLKAYYFAKKLLPGIYEDEDFPH